MHGVVRATRVQTISDYVRYYLAAHSTEVNRPPMVKTAATLARRICYENKVSVVVGWRRAVVLMGGASDARGVRIRSHRTRMNM